MKRLAWLAFAQLLLLLAPAPGGAGSLTLAAPQNFTGSALSSESIRWTWDAVLGSSTSLGATRYELREETTNSLIATLPGPGTSPLTFDESGLTPGNTYCRHVIAYNGTDAASTVDVCVTLAAVTVPCKMTGEGPDVVRVLGTRPKKNGRGEVKITFTAFPGDGEFDPKPKNNSPGLIDLRPGTPSATTFNVWVTGKKQSKEANDASFTVTYTCADMTVHTVTWLMTVLGDSDKHLDCDAVAVPGDTGSVRIGITAGLTGGIEFRAYSSQESINFNWTSISDDGDATGAARGDVSASFENELSSTNIDYSVTGLKASKQLGDVIVTGEVTGTSEEGVCKAMARRTWSVRAGPNPSDCNWSSEGGHGLSIPANKKPVSVVVTFKADPHGAATMKWNGPDNRGLPAGITVIQLNNAGGETLVLQVNADSTAQQSAAKNSFFVKANYECNDGWKSTIGTAIHSLTIYSLK